MCRQLRPAMARNSQETPVASPHLIHPGSVKMMLLRQPRASCLRLYGTDTASRSLLCALTAVSISWHPLLRKGQVQQPLRRMHRLSRSRSNLRRSPRPLRLLPAVRHRVVFRPALSPRPRGPGMGSSRVAAPISHAARAYRRAQISPKPAVLSRVFHLRTSRIMRRKFRSPFHLPLPRPLQPVLIRCHPEQMA